MYVLFLIEKVLQYAQLFNLQTRKPAYEHKNITFKELQYKAVISQQKG